MEDSERFDLAFDYAWVDLNSKLYDETKQLVKKLWDGPLDSGKFFVTIAINTITSHHKDTRVGWHDDMRKCGHIHRRSAWAILVF